MAQISFAQSTNVPPGASGFGTGGGQALQRSNLSFMLPTNLPSVSLSFDVGFGTDEVVVSGEFYDSFSATLRNSNRTFTASLLTADVFGVAWAPTDTSGNTLTNTLLFEPTQFPPVAHLFALRFSYHAAVEIPAFMFGQSGTLLVSLFDNLDQEASVGFVQNIRLGPGLNAPLALESSAAANGPYAEELGIRINRVLQTITLPGGGMARFFRLRGQGPNQITRMRAVGNDFVFDYEISPPGSVPVLESSARVQGPFASEGGVTADPVTKRLQVSRTGQGRFYRLRSDTLLVVRRLERAGSNLIFHYDLP